MDDILQIANALRDMREDGAKLRAFTQGDEATEVDLDGVATPSLRKCLAEAGARIDARVDAEIGDLVAARMGAADSATEAGAAAELAGEALEETRAAIARAGAAFDFYGFRRTADGRLLIETGTPGPLDATGCDAVVTLPAGARFAIDARGHLIITLGED